MLGRRVMFENNERFRLFTRNNNIVELSTLQILLVLQAKVRARVTCLPFSRNGKVTRNVILSLLLKSWQ